jgi:hypothetical protein
MKKNFYSSLLLVALFVLVSFRSSAANTIGLWFGVKDAGVCIGKGFCHEVASSATSVGVDGVPTTFALDPLDESILVVTFKMSDLVTLQPNEATYVANAAQPATNGITPTYQFDAPFSLNTPSFAQLGLATNPSIQPNTIILVTIVNDVVTMRIRYQHD